jgi:hypothetical protein
MAVCAAVGCADPALDVWRPREERPPRFHYLVCEFHGQALRSDARYRMDGDHLHIDSLPRLLDWSLTQAGGNAIVRISYGDDLETVRVDLQADLAMLSALRESLDEIESDRPSRGRTNGHTWS